MKIGAKTQQLTEIKVGDYVVLKSSNENMTYGNDIHKVESIEHIAGDGMARTAYFVENDPTEHPFHSVLLATDYLIKLSESKLNMASHLAIIDAQIKELMIKKEITQKKLNSIVEYSSALKSNIIDTATKIINRLNGE